MTEPVPGLTAENYDLLTTVVRRTARAARLSREDAQDFEQSVHLRLLERHYDVFSQFEGRSSLRTYLFIVVRRLLLDWRVSLLGKWRPSTAARRLGPAAIRLERLVVRDGYSVSEAITTERMRGASPGELERLVERLPPRLPRRFVADVAPEELPAATFEDPVEMAERRRAELQLRRAVVEAIRQLPDEDRRLLHARYQCGRSVQHVAETLAVDPKDLYRRLGRVMRRLRKAVEDAALPEVDGPRRSLQA